jgi:hypothetical protein
MQNTPNGGLHATPITVYQKIHHSVLTCDSPFGVIHPSAAKHTLQRSLTSSQQQKHQQIICCALAKTYGRHS